MNKKLNDKIKGALYGCAYGDTLGIGTEFMTKREVRKYYPEGLRSFNRIIRDSHRSQWARGEWTHDTGVMAMLIESGLEKGRIDLRHITEILQKWGESHPIDIAPYFHRLLTDPEWLENPVEVSAARWHKGDMDASNENIQHSVVAAFISDDSHYEDDARKLSIITHADTRCETTGLLSAKMARSLLFEDHPADFEDLVATARRLDSRVLPYLDIAYNGELTDLDLDDEETLAYTRKCMASAFWTVWHCDNAADAIHCLVDEGGDSDTNAALAGTFAGIRYGYDAIPEEKNNIIGKEYLDELAERLTAHVEANLM